MISTLRKKLRHLVLNWLDQLGIEVNKKEYVTFLGKQVFVSKGAFTVHDKDDAWLFALSRHNKRILDIGCNIGQSSMLHLLNTDNEIVCVDPNPKALTRCAENLIYNNLVHQARFVNAFLGDTDGLPIRFYSSLTDAAGSMYASFAITSSSIGKSKLVDQTTATSLCKKLNFSPHFIKIDVEGAENLVLRGLSGLVNDCRPIILVEMHSGLGLSITENTAETLLWCQNNTYTPYYLKQHTELTTTEMIKDRGRYHLLLIHSSLNYPEYLKNIPENASLSSFFEAAVPG